MPQQQTYEITLKDGRVFEIDAPRPPTPDDVRRLLARMEAPEPPPADPTPAEPARGGMAGYTVLGDLLTGAVKDVGKGIKGAADWGRRNIPGVAALDQLGSVQVGDTLEPTNDTQVLGGQIGRVAQYMAPGRLTQAGATAALRFLPKAAAVLGRAAPVVARGVTGGAGAVPIAVAHGDDPVAAGVTGGVAEAVLPEVAKGAVWLGRKGGSALVRRGGDFSAGKLRSMVGEDLETTAQRVTDTILDRNITGVPKARRLIDADKAVIEGIEAGPAGDIPTQLDTLVPERFDELAAGYRKAGAPDAYLDAVERFRAGTLSPRAPLATDVVTGQQSVPTGLLGPTGQPLTRMEPITSRGYRQQVSMRDAMEVAKGTARARRGDVHGQLQGAEIEASKAFERAIRDASKDAVPALRAPMQRITNAIDAERVLDTTRSAGDALTGTQTMANAAGGKIGLALALLKQMGVRGGIRTAQAGRTGGAVLEEPVLQALLTAYMARPDDKELEAEVLRALTQAGGR